MQNIYSISLIILLFASAIASSKVDSSKTVKSYKLSEPLILDGILNESVYKNPPIEDFTQKQPDEGKPATENSHIWFSYDELNIYISGKFYDSQPDSIDITLMRRDNMTESDWLWIFLDPYNDDRTGFYFAINPGGSICDGTLYNDGWMDDSWDGIWETKTNIDDEGWSVEVKIPFSQLRFKESEKMVWGINVNRDIKRKHEMSFYVMVPSTESGFVSHFADLEGLDGIKPKQRFELLPYIVQKAQYLRHEADDPFYKGNQYETSFGGDLKFSLGSNLNVDATINPDFGQVEVDPAIVNLSAFETFFDEKRPFFIEGSNVFQFGYGGSNNNWGFNFSNPELFYSRRIGRPPQGDVTIDGYTDYPSETRIIGAGKLTGKIDETWSIGGLTALTERTYARVQSDETGEMIEEEVEPFTHYGVFRTQKEFNEGKQAVGMMFTTVNRDLSNPNLSELLRKNAYTFGADGWTFLDEDETYVITGSVIGSYTHGSQESMIRLQKEPYRYFQRPDKTFMPLDSNRASLAGIFSRFMLNKQKGNFYINAALGTASPGFEYNDLGSQWFADRINGHVVLGYRWYEPDEIFRRKNVYFAYNRNSDYEDNVSRSGFYSSNSVEFLNFWGVGLSFNYNFESISTTLTRGGPKVIMPPNFSINVNAYTDSREKIIFHPFGGFWRNSSGSNDYYFGLEFEWKPNPQIGFTIGPEYAYIENIYQWVDRFNDPYATETFDVRYVFGELTQKTISANIRLNWIFNPQLSLQLYVQPLIAVGDYRRFKELAKPNSEEYNIYGENGSTINYNSETDEYEVDPDGIGPSESFSFSNPDFNFKSLRGNLVLRWEVLPGSVFYFVWTHNKDNFDNPGDLNLRRDLSNLWRSEADNVFLVKFSYWFDI
jgi:hypothetical protein